MENIIDRKSKKTIKIDSLNLEDYHDSGVKQLRWEGDNEIKAKVSNFCSPIGEKGINRQVKCKVAFDSDQADCRVF